MTKTGKYDGALLGATLGLIAATPSIAQWTSNFFESIVPSNWLIFGDWSLALIGISAGALIGLIVDKTR